MGGILGIALVLRDPRIKPEDDAGGIRGSCVRGQKTEDGELL